MSKTEIKITNLSTPNKVIVNDVLYHYGVYDPNEVEYLHEEIDKGTDLLYEAWLDENPKHLEEEYDGEYENSESETLIGDWRKNDEGKWEEYFGEKGYSAIATLGEFSGTHVMVTLSKWGIMANRCSPCYPNAGNPQNKGSLLTFSLPPDLLGESWDRVGDIFEIEELKEV